MALSRVKQDTVLQRFDAEAGILTVPVDLAASHGFTMHEATINLNIPYLVKGIFDRNQLVVLWGAPGSGKTFTAISLAAYVGAGLPWLGRRVKKSRVLYVCAESSRAHLENRVAALKQRHPELATSEIVLLPISVDLLHGAQDVANIIYTAQQMGDIGLIVIDTLAVTFGGGNENAPEDMNEYVKNAKRIKSETGAAVMIVHHCGKDEARGMRGHTSLLGALDAELVVEKLNDAGDGPNRILRAGKLREGESGADLCAFRLDVVSLGIDPDGDAVTTCVMEAATGPVVRRPSAGTQDKLLKALEAQHLAGATVWTEKDMRKIAEQCMSRNMVTKSILALREAGFIVASVGGHRLVTPPN